jgi:membrane protein
MKTLGPLLLFALLLTLGAILFFLIVVALIAVLPAILQVFGTGGIVWLGIQVARWVLIVAVIAVGLAVLYRVAPDRDAPKIRWVSVGAGIATLLWIIASVGFSVYVSNFGSYAKTYGALAGIVILLLWLFITAYAILLGAEINAESEQQTVADTTKGEPQPLGERDAVKADSVPPGE